LAKSAINANKLTDMIGDSQAEGIAGRSSKTSRLVTSSGLATITLSFRN